MNAEKADTSGVVKSQGYKPLPHGWFAQPRDLPPFSHATVRAMLLDPGIRLNLRMRAAPLAGVFFGFKDGEDWTEGVQCKRAEVGAFVYRQLQRIWKTFLPGILRAQVWGWSAGEITLKLSEHNLAEIDKLEPRHAGDCRLLLQGHKKYGVRINRVEGRGYVDLSFPYCWFHAFDAEDGELYGTSNLLGAYSPWADKWFNGGGLDTRRLFMHKDAYGGRKLWYPEGSTYIDGREVPNSDIARQIVEQMESGGVATLPSTVDEHGNLLWRLEEPNVSANPQHILQYPKDLDDEIRHGQEIPDDVISSDGTGAWAGKRIPLAAFYASLDSWIVQILCDLKEQVFDPLILLNWGEQFDYEIGHKPLAEQAMEQQANAGTGDGGPIGPFGNVERDGPARMSLLDPVDAVGRGVLSAAGIVNAARQALDSYTPVRMSSATYQYSSTQFNLPAELAQVVRDMGSRIPDAALATDGREADPHITIKYGLFADTPDELRKVVAGFGPVLVTLGRATIFPANESQSQRGGEQFDVVKIDIEGESIRQLNALISGALPHFDSHPGYNPHATIAYVKPGLGSHFAAGLNDLEGCTVLFDQFVFSDKNRNQIVISLLDGGDDA